MACRVIPNRDRKMLAWWSSWCLPICLVWAMASDARRFEIPHTTQIVPLAVFLIAAAFGAWPWDEVGWRIGLAVLVLALGFVLSVVRVLGAGDSKLIAALSLWLGPGLMLPCLFVMAIAGGVLAAILLIYRKRPLPAAWAGRPWLSELHAAQNDVPYGIAIGIAGLAVFPEILARAAH